jgi:hypothetical protein
MGCVNSSEEKAVEKEEKKEEFSWDKRQKLDRNDYMVSKRKGETIVKKPGYFLCL